MRKYLDDKNIEILKSDQNAYKLFFFFKWLEEKRILRSKDT